MSSPEATLYCPNPLCQAPNPESHRFCQQCRSRLTHRYLWVVDPEADAWKPGDFLVERYQCKQGQIFLDTKPGLLPESPIDLPEKFEPYLHLLAHQPQIPRLYTLIPLAPHRTVGLLEEAPIYPTGHGQNHPQVMAEGTLMPSLESRWSEASALRQLNWLWQLAQLWIPLSKEGVAQSLLNPALMRVEGGVVRLLEVQSDRAMFPASTVPTLVNLGAVWQTWLPTAKPAIAPFLQALCQQMQTGQLKSVDHLIASLDRAIHTYSQTQRYSMEIVTLTDQGPTRQRNEDACFPASGSRVVYSKDAHRDRPLVVVCDGIGGHEGGNIASNLAIETIQQTLQPHLNQPSQLEPVSLTIELEKSTLAANDAITQRNDTEHRFERQRMGTTLVMALGNRHEVYITHVGDSRAYRITALGCHQITLDDDLASREVRLGYSLPRHAVQQPGSGSLVQALGMNVSTMLHPTVQRFILDEDCVFLLCSDGLSDNDRVEEYWQTALLPVVTDGADLAAAAQQLVEIANQQNGHDNVTVGVVSCRVTPDPNVPPLSLSEALLDEPVANHPLIATETSSSTVVKTQDLSPPERSRPTLPKILLGVLTIVGLGGLFSYLLVTGLDAFSTREALRPAPDPQPASPIPSVPTPLASVSPSPFTVGTRMLVKRSTPEGDRTAPFALLPQPGNSSSDSPRSNVPVESVLEVVSQQRNDSNQTWLEVKVCSLPPGASPAAPPSIPTLRLAQPGEAGWVQEDAIAPFVTANVSLTKAQLGTCATERKLIRTNREPRPN